MRSPECVVDGEVCALDEQGRPSFSAMQQGKPARRSSTRCSTCSRWTACPSSTCRSTSDARVSKRCSNTKTKGAADGAALGVLRRRRGAVRSGEAAEPRRRDGEGAGSRYCEGKRNRDWLKIKTHGRAGVRHRRLHEGRGPPRATASARSCSPSTRATSCAGSATSAPASARRRSASCSTRSSRCGVESSPLAVVPKMPSVQQGRRRVGRAEARRRGEVRGVDARRPSARAVVPGAARRQVCARCASRAAGGRAEAA